MKDWFRMFLIVPIVLLLSGCFGTTKIEYQPYPQYKLVEISPKQLQKQPPPEFKITKEAWDQMRPEQKEVLLVNLIADLTKIVDSLNLALSNIETSQLKQKSELERQNKLIEETAKNPKKESR